MAIGLALGGWSRAAVAWLTVVAAVLGTTLLLKLALIGTGALAWAGIYSPSGHTVVTALLAGGVAGLVTADRPAAAWVAGCAAAGAGLAMGLVRVALGSHSPGEVLVVLPLGILGAAALVRLQGRRPPGVRLWPALLLGTVVIVTMCGAHLQAETAIARLVGVSPCDGGSARVVPTRSGCSARP